MRTRPKRVPISPGVILGPEDSNSPTLPGPFKQKFYRPFVAKFQFAASWIRFDISFAVSQCWNEIAVIKFAFWQAHPTGQHFIT
jgi:hypothetical protein